MRYGSLRLVREFDVRQVFKYMVWGLFGWTFPMMWHMDTLRYIDFLPHVIVLMAYVVISDVNDERRRHNDIVLGETSRVSNHIEYASKEVNSIFVNAR